MENIYGKLYLDELMNLPSDWVRTDNKGAKYLKICVGERKSPGTYGETHHVRVVLPAGVQPGEIKTFIADLKPFTQDTNNENYK